MPPPKSTTTQTYPADQIAAGQRLFTAQCGFCHGRDAMGGESGPDLTRAALVAEDVRGDKLGPLLRGGRVDKGMPAFTLSAADLGAIVAFVHDQKTKAESLTGGRRTGMSPICRPVIRGGPQYFAGACASCHSPTGDLAGVARAAARSRIAAAHAVSRAGPRRIKATVTVTLPSGESDRPARVSRRVHDRAHRHRRLVSSVAGWTRDIRRQRSAAGPCRSTGKIHDGDMHDVLAYLQTLR